MRCYFFAKQIVILGLLAWVCLPINAQQVTPTPITIKNALPNSSLVEQQKATQAAQQRQAGRILKMDKMPNEYRFKILTPNGRIREVTIPRQKMALPTQPKLTQSYGQAKKLDGPVLYTPHQPTLPAKIKKQAPVLSDKKEQKK